MNLPTKIAAWLLLFVVYTFNINCNDSLLSKFHQTGYKLKDFRLELINYSKEYFNFIEIKTFKFNRTTAVVNISVNMKIATRDEQEALVQGYKFLSNEYRHFPIRFQVNVQKAFDANIIGLQTIKNCGNLTSFIFEKDITYYACNFVIDETRFPPLIPNGRYKVDVKFLHKNKEISRAFIFGEVYTPIKYPKK